MEISTKSTNETKELAFRIASKLKKGDILALYGDLGSGKTTFVKFVVEAMGINARVQSPTFVLHKKYEYVNHFDFYRLENIGEVLDLGFEEILKQDTELNIIEWPEIIEDYLPNRTIHIKFESVDENTRKITIQNLN